MTDKTSLFASASPRAPALAGMSGLPFGGFSPLLRGPQVTFSPDEGAGGGLTVEQAIAQLDAHEDEPAAAGGQDEGAAAAAAAPGAEHQESEGEASSPEEASGQAETLTPEGSEETGAEAGAVAPAEPPKYWSQEAKAQFAALDPALQAVVLSQEGPREEAAAKAKEEAAQIRQAAEKEMEGLGQLSEQLNVLLPRVLQKVRDQWGDNPDWVAFANTHGADKMAVAKAQWEQDRTAAAELQRVAAETNVRAHHAYVAKEFETLRTLSPELVDPKDGPAKRTEVVTFLKTLGIPDQAITKIPAVEMVLARETMLYRKLQSKAAAPKPAPKPAPATTMPLARGAAAGGSTDPQSKQAQAAAKRLRHAARIEDRVDLANSQGD